MVLQQGFAKHYERRGGGGGGKGCARRDGKLMFLAAPKPPLYIGEGERGPVPSRSHLEGRGGGQEGRLAPQARWRCPPPLGFSTLGALGPWGGAHQPTRGWFPPILSPSSPPGQVAPPGGPLDTFRWSRYNTDNPRTIPVTETGLPIYKSLPPDHSGTPRDVRDLIRDSEQHAVTTYKLPL